MRVSFLRHVGEFGVAGSRPLCSLHRNEVANMAWHDKFSGSATRINAEYEQELHLADQARMGADWALGALIARYQPTVTRYLTRLTGNSSRAQTLAEQIFLRMERRLHGPHGGQHLRLWLLRACTESGLDELRRPHRTTPHDQLATAK